MVRHKNQKYDEIKSHHYIISFDPKDRDECGLTGEQAQQLGLEYCKKNFPGHQTLVCTHMDGHNGSGNIHVHIVINSLRKNGVGSQDFMERDCDSRAGNKHHLTNDYLAYLKQPPPHMTLRNLNRFLQKNSTSALRSAGAGSAIPTLTYFSRSFGLFPLIQPPLPFLPDCQTDTFSAVSGLPVRVWLILPGY